MALKYIGDGTFIIGVPARDLTDDEAKQYADVIAEQEKIIGMKLYRKVAKRKATSEDGNE